MQLGIRGGDLPRLMRRQCGSNVASRRAASPHVMTRRGVGSMLACSPNIMAEVHLSWSSVTAPAIVQPNQGRSLLLKYETMIYSLLYFKYWFILFFHLDINGDDGTGRWLKDVCFYIC